MMWMFIVGLSLIVFINRYIFLSPQVSFNLPVFVEKMLKYAAPCLMISMCVPIIFYDHHQLRALVNNAYLWSAIFTILITIWTRKMLLSIVMSLLIFYIFNYFLS